MASTTLTTLPTEVFTHIVDFIGDKATLFSLVQVDRTCFNNAISKLWDRAPYNLSQPLSLMRNDARRQFYISLVRKTSVDKPSLDFRGMKFSSLRLVTFSDGAGPQDIDHAAFLQSRLRTVSYSGSGTLTTSSLEMLRSNCPDLQSFRICRPQDINVEVFTHCLQSFEHITSLDLGDNEAIIEGFFMCSKDSFCAKLQRFSLRSTLENTDPDAFLRFLCKAQTLSSLDFGSWREVSTRFVNHKVISSLASCSLEELTIGTWLTTEVVRVRHLLEAAEAQQIFKNMRSLNLKGQVEVIMPLLSSSTITDLELEVEDFDSTECNVIGGMVQLRSLFLTFPVSMTLTMEHLNILRPLRRLDRLLLAKSETYELLEELLQLPWITDEYFRVWISSFPLLKQLYLDWDLDTPFTENALTSIAHGCPLLESCTLMWAHDLTQWQRLSDQLLPNLEDISLGNVKDLSKRSLSKAMIRARPIVGQIRRVLPRLRYLCIYSETRSAVAVENVFRPGSCSTYADTDEELSSSDEDEDGSDDGGSEDEDGSDDGGSEDDGSEDNGSEGDGSEDEELDDEGSDYEESEDDGSDDDESDADSNEMV